MRKVKLALFGLLGMLGISVFLAVMVPYRIATVLSGSMEPTLMTGEWVIIHTGVPARHEKIIAFVKEFETDDGTTKLLLTKRVVGMGGDHLVADGSSLFVNGRIVGEINDIFDITVPGGHLFVIGDNYDASYDSRFWADPWVKEEDVIGMVTRRLNGLEEVH